LQHTTSYSGSVYVLPGCVPSPQGDPGTTQLMFDVGDPLIAKFGMQSE
jgi:hypothetical protein